MKRSLVFNSVLLGLVLAVGITGCKHKPKKGVTIIPGQKATPVATSDTDKTPITPDLTKPITGNENPVGTKPITDGDLSSLDIINGMIADVNKFKANTVYFEYDRHVVRASEKGKVEEVALYLKSALDHKLMIDGHCDERGTEEYNRALGERRALALREYLIKLGIGGDRLYTRTYGEDRPAVEGHDEAAWSKNRRGEFILLKPKPVAN